MKKFKFIPLFLLAFTITFVGCKKDNITDEADIIPANFKVDIPNTLSKFDVLNTKSGDIPDGGDIYTHLTNFIAVGEAAADIVNEIIVAIGQYDLAQAMSFSFQSEEDGRTKTVVIIENSEFDGQTWEFELSLTDEDGGKGLQVFWNNSPVKGIAIMNPYNIHRGCVAAKCDGYYWVNENTMYRVDYSEAETAYDAQMTVYISGLTLPTVPEKSDYDRFTMETMKMFVGKKGDIIDVYGNSNHPLAWFLNPTKVGYSWAFVAAGDLSTERAVAEAGLPLSTVDSDSRVVILKDNSIHNVLYNEIAFLYPDATHQIILDYLVNTEAPAYFGPLGFVSAGTPPEGSVAYDAAEASMNLLTPYSPYFVSNLEINFKADAVQ